jgi:hypothetical protein
MTEIFIFSSHCQSEQAIDADAGFIAPLFNLPKLASRWFAADIHSLAVFNLQLLLYLNKTYMTRICTTGVPGLFLPGRKGAVSASRSKEKSNVKNKDLTP